jgi:hypothetical protein
MVLLTLPGREAVARLIALGYPRMLAARRLGYLALLRRPRPPARRPVPRTQRAPVDPAETAPEPAAAPVFAPQMTREAWLAKYGPMLKARAGGGGAGI